MFLFCSISDFLAELENTIGRIAFVNSTRSANISPRACFSYSEDVVTNGVLYIFSLLQC